MHPRGQRGQLGRRQRHLAGDQPVTASGWLRRTKRPPTSATSARAPAPRASARPPSVGVVPGDERARAEPGEDADRERDGQEPLHRVAEAIEERHVPMEGGIDRACSRPGPGASESRPSATQNHTHRLRPRRDHRDARPTRAGPGPDTRSGGGGTGRRGPCERSMPSTGPSRTSPQIRGTRSSRSRGGSYAQMSASSRPRLAARTDRRRTPRAAGAGPPPGAPRARRPPPAPRRRVGARPATRPGVGRGARGRRIPTVR